MPAATEAFLPRVGSEDTAYHGPSIERHEWHVKCHDARWEQRSADESCASHGWRDSVTCTRRLRPSARRESSKVIQESRQLLRLRQGWDGEGALPIEEATWIRAVEFLERQARCLWDRGCVLPSPDITPVPDGSIDLHWDRPGFELLINIPRDPSSPAEFYGDNRGWICIRGHLDTAQFNQGLVLWLMRG